MKFRILGTIAIAFSLSACSTIVNGTNQAVMFNSGDVVDAKCNITGGSDHAVDITFSTPEEVRIPRSKKALNVTCSKTGYEDTQQVVASKLEGATAGNILAGGVVGVGVDALTGALYKYPDAVKIILNKLGTAEATQTQEAPTSEDGAVTS